MPFQEGQSVTLKTQLEYNGHLLTVERWSKLLGMDNANSLRAKLQSGKTIEEIAKELKVSVSRAYTMPSAGRNTINL